MSTIQANAILDASGGNTVTVNGVTPNSEVLKGRNLIINGAMQVAQRGTSFTGLANSPVYTVDRWEYRRINAWSTGRFSVTQESDGPAGFPKSIKLATTTAETDTTSIAALTTRLEGLDCQSLKYGSSSAESITLSFWVKSYQTGTYGFALNVANLNQSIYGTLYTINQSNTWEKKTITIPAPALASSTAINNDTAQGLELIWHFTYRDSAGTLTNNSWDESTGSAALRWYSVNGQTINGSTSTNNYIQITGVKLEVGSVATEFDHRSYGEELALCQRYFEKIDDVGNAHRLNGIAWSTTNINIPIPFLVEKRANPTVVIGDVGEVYRAGAWRTPSGSAITGTGLRGCTIDIQSTSYTQENGYFIRNHELTIDAEL